MEAERRYTDRDVRVNFNEAYRVVHDYLASYEGEFEFLVDCKMRIAADYSLTTGMIRGVLNCMRVDARYRGPLPEFSVEDDRAEIIPMKSERRPKRIQYPKECDIVEFHDPHPIGPEELGPGRWNCYGKYAINRDFEIFTRAQVNRPYVAAVSPTSLVHRVHDGWVAKVKWFPIRHGIGFNYEPDLHVKPACDTPRFIRNPNLLNEEEFEAMQMNEDTYRVRCGRCL